MPRHNSSQVSDLFAPRRHGGGVSGNFRPYPRRPAHKVAALLIDPSNRTIRNVYISAIPTGVEIALGRKPTAIIEHHFYHAHFVDDRNEEVADRVTLPGSRISIQGRVLITSTDHTDIPTDIIDVLNRRTVFSRCDAYEPQRAVK